jgi:uncharacterized membrane protein YphA (DoxX/SURF4 family)
VQAILNKQPSRVYLLIRVFFVVLLAASGIGKLSDMSGFYHVVDSYQVFPIGMIPLSSWGLVSLELGLAGALLAGKHLKSVAALVFFLHCLYFAWLSIALIRGLNIPNCGCFGVHFPRPLTSFTLLEDGFLLLISGALWQSQKTKTN